MPVRPALLLLLLLLGLWGAPVAATPVPVIIDADPGDDIDDAYALAWAVTDPGLEVLAVTVAWGDTGKRARLVRRLLAEAGRSDIPVGEGPVTANKTPFTQARWAGRGPDGARVDAVELIRSQVAKRPGQITLVALAPMSNVAALLDRDPGVLARLQRVLFMGGSVRAGYNKGGVIPNAEPSAEYNMVQDIAAARRLLNSGVKLSMFPLDSTQIKFDETRRDLLFAHGTPVTDALALLTHQWRVNNEWGQLTPTLFDAVPVGFALDPALCPVQSMRIDIDDKGFTREVAGAANVDVCLRVQGEAVMDRMTAALLAAKR
jgi:inosine-uridine nucleoside N-ribohydrolase